ncbi:hypothetical protein [Actinomadura rugatobispora]|uniref:Uncharacterized protein n=1 Tax=Actinomadura rugatobispora TaxID=1994 RepID=A0ABW1A3Y9_9ACTN|nr:hypothetical protein GCM10010200_082600 [Actinomadura rugatobispora]
MKTLCSVPDADRRGTGSSPALRIGLAMVMVFAAETAQPLRWAGECDLALTCTSFVDTRHAVILLVQGVVAPVDPHGDNWLAIRVLAAGPDWESVTQRGATPHECGRSLREIDRTAEGCNGFTVYSSRFKGVVHLV